MDTHSLVSSTILNENGIREPLYITALKYAGVNVTSDMKPGHIDTLDTSKVNDIVRDWYKSIKKEVITTKEAINAANNAGSFFGNMNPAHA